MLIIDVLWTISWSVNMSSMQLCVKLCRADWYKRRHTWSQAPSSSDTSIKNKIYSNGNCSFYNQLLSESFRQWRKLSPVRNITKPILFTYIFSNFFRHIITIFQQFNQLDLESHHTQYEQEKSFSNINTRITENMDSLIDLGDSVSDYRPLRHVFDSWHFHNFKCGLGLERSTQPHEDNWVAS